VARTRISLLACGLALALLTACSGGGDDNDAAPTTVAPAATAAPGATTTPTFTGQNSSQFCGLARTYNERFTSVGPNATPAQLRTVAREGQTAITEAVRTAPAEIKPDIEVLARTFTTLLAELEKVNFEITRLPPTALQALSAPDFQASTQRFQAYLRDVCKVGA
jgi:hypothetical protein